MNKNKEKDRILDFLCKKHKIILKTDIYPKAWQNYLYAYCLQKTCPIAIFYLDNNQSFPILINLETDHILDVLLEISKEHNIYLGFQRTSIFLKKGTTFESLAIEMELNEEKK